MERQGDAIISGMGKMNGGKFNIVDISGLGKLFGDVEANEIRISGKGTIEGNVKAALIYVNGDGLVKGNSDSKSTICSGNFKLNGYLKSDEIRISGRCRILGEIRSNKVGFDGYLSTTQGLEADEFNCNGSFSIDGLLNANKIDVNIDGYCYAKEIGGECINVRLKKRHSFTTLVRSVLMLFTGKDRELNTLKADVIEGTTVILEHTKAGIVRGNNVTIGPNCQIDLVEYIGELEVDSNSIVRKKTKIS